MKSLAENLSKDKFYCICTHINPDLDAISSLLTLLIVLRRGGFKVKPNLQDSPQWTAFLNGWDLYLDLEKQEIPEEYHLIALDCGSADRVWPKEIIKSAKSIINIDHHFDNPLFGSVNICEPTISSTAELLFLLFKQDKIPLDAKIASNIYAGMLFDTGGFRYSNTKEGTFQSVIELIKLGLNPSMIADNVFSKWDEKGFQALQISLASVEYWEEDQILFSYVSYHHIKEQNLANADFEGVIDILRQHRKAKYSILVREIEKGYFKGSVRAKEPYEIGDAIRVLGGGGHKRAAGFSIRDQSIEEIKKVTLSNFRKRL